MGSGKTTLIKSLLKTMGSDDQAHSPSFSLVNEYVTKHGIVYHFDLYRLEDPTEVWDIGFEDYLSSNNWLFIEWPELILDIIPSDFIKIDITIATESSRSLKLTVNKELLTENLAMTDK
jgi:tRNA threonylcarbamoyladenosine biosynthesis protein TsaE